MTLPHVDWIRPQDTEGPSITFIMAGRNAPALAAIRRRFEAEQSFWVNNRPAVNGTLNGFGPRPPVITKYSADDWNRVAPSSVETESGDRVPTDDWPFLYLRTPAIPGVNVRNMVLLALLSMGILYLFSPVRRLRPNWQMFFLGAGFMLLETKSVVHMALLFGSTWLVNSVVFFAILVMILTSNVFVLAVKPGRLWPYYALLVGALMINVFVPMSRFLSLPGSQKTVVSCAVVFVPIFFAGIIFGASFRSSSQPDVDFGSNIAGAILGGLAESLSLIVGFNYLLIIAVVFYVLSALSRRPAVLSLSDGILPA
jgi:hypothetical protein